MKSFARFLLGIFICSLPLLAQVRSPKDYFGHEMGADRQLISWDQIGEYFHYLDNRSDRVMVEELGRTTLDKPFLMVTITAAGDMTRLERLKVIQQRLGRADDLSPEEAAALIHEGKTVVLLTLNIHSTEIASTQESVELAWELATQEDERTRTILENVVLLIVPSLNPDGLEMVRNYYNKTLGTDSEGSSFPGLYHHYAGHDNNRDWFFFNLAESRLVARILYHEWYPEIIYDQHQMGNSSARLFMPPYQDPLNPNVHPRITAATNSLGKYVVAELIDQGFTGIVTGARFNAFYEGTMSKTPLWHNRIGILSEAASVRIATPTFHPKTSLRGMDHALNEYQAQTNFPLPWPGGWWRLRDLVEYEKAATYAILDLAATHKIRYKTNFYELNREAIEKGRTEPPYAWIITPDQHDPTAALELLRRLRYGNVKIYRALEPIETSSGVAPAGSFVIPLAQANRPYIKDLMEIQHYPDIRLYPGGPPLTPYDLTAWTLPLMMGVEVCEATAPLTGKLKEEDHPTWELPPIKEDASAYLVARRWTNSYRLINGLLKGGKTVGILTEDLTVASETFPKGTFIIPVTRKNRAALLKASRTYEVSISPLNTPPPFQTIRAARIAIYGPWVSAYDEGWTRYVFDQFGFTYTILRNPDFQDVKSITKFDVVIMPSQRTSQIVDGKRRSDQKEYIGDAPFLPKYQGGIGKEGVKNLKQYLLGGGTILFLGQSGDFAINELGVPATNILKDVPRKEFYAPGTIFKVALDPSSHLTYGMPESIPIYYRQDPAYRLRSGARPHRETAVYDSRNPLLSGWMVSNNILPGKVALAEIATGKGTAVLYGFRVQNRAQTWGTFKLLFNALYAKR